MVTKALACRHLAAGCPADCVGSLAPLCHTFGRHCPAAELLVLAQQPLELMLSRQLLSPGRELHGLRQPADFSIKQACQGQCGSCR